MSDHQVDPYQSPRPTDAPNGYRLETLAVHAGQTLDATLSRGVPVHRTSSFVFKSTEHAASLFALKELGNIYSRITNPTCDVLEQRLTRLEGGGASVALASGTAAVFYSVITLARAERSRLAIDIRRNLKI